MSYIGVKKKQLVLDRVLLPRLIIFLLIPEEEDEDAEHEEDDGSDDEGWITPSNFKSKKLEMLGVDTQVEEEEDEIIVACLTSDFAMQNVLKQMGK